ncbi:MAG TPA: tetratricopeptide repeat protein [Terracidiphilus sp.]|nr:tetratricopeptide repeat protein [Terracidiphilus sp.]
MGLARNAFEKGDLAEAEQLCLKLLARDVQHPECLNLLGRILYATGRVEASVALYHRAIRIDPGNASHHSNLGLALKDLGRHDESLAALQHAVRLDPLLAEAHSNLGIFLLERGRIDDAMEHFHQSDRLKPNWAPLLNNLGAAYSDLGQHDRAMETLNRALAADPTHVGAKWNRALALLLHGDLRQGWQEHETRWQRTERPRHFPGPLWKGEPLHGARILLHSEQGLGDSIQFLRFVPLVQAAGGTVLLDVPSGLRRLAESLPGIAALTADGQNLSDYAFQCPLMSLPLALGITLEDLPGPIPYLTVPAAAAQAAEQFPWPASGPRIGLVWRGNPRHRRDHLRSIPFETLAPILDLPGFHFFSLQITLPGTQPPDFGRFQSRITNFAPHLADLADTAAMLAHLDLLLAVDTSVAHLAGALGRPVWLLLPAVPDWRWMRDREDSPWYPSARLFRQSTLSDWGPLLDRVRRQLLARFPTAGN